MPLETGVKTAGLTVVVKAPTGKPPLPKPAIGAETLKLVPAKLKTPAVESAVVTAPGLKLLVLVE